MSGNRIVVTPNKEAPPVVEIKIDFPLTESSACDERSGDGGFVDLTGEVNRKEDDDTPVQDLAY